MLSITFLAMDEDEDELFHVPSNGDLALNIKKLLAKQETFISSKSPLKKPDLFHKFLGFHMGLLGLRVKQGLHHMPIRTNQSIHVNAHDFSTLSSRVACELKIESLRILTSLFKHTKKSRIFSFWYALLPGCTFNPCQKGILELICHPDHRIQEKALDLLLETFLSSSTHLQLANAHCRTASFTPVCLEFALALGR